ncbi:4094_t:CDS:2, partial [Gigaspora margarita]
MFNGYSEPVKYNDSDDPSRLYCQNAFPKYVPLKTTLAKQTNLKNVTKNRNKEALEPGLCDQIRIGAEKDKADGLEICNKNNKYKAPALE